MFPLSASTERCELQIVYCRLACVRNTMNARTTLEAISWDATITLSHSHLTYLWETFSILDPETSVWQDVSKHAEKLVSCLQDLGKPSGYLKSTTCVLILRDRQFCHCGNVEPPTEFSVDLDKCGTSCSPTPNDLEIDEACGTTLHTMVSCQTFETILAPCSIDLLHLLHKLCLLGLHY